jgi:cell division protein FtsB
MIKYRYIILILLLEIFIFYIFFIKQGFEKIDNLSNEIVNIKLKIEDTKKDIELKEKDIYNWNNSSFYKEKYLREQLLFCYPNEEIFIFKEED